MAGFCFLSALELYEYENGGLETFDKQSPYNLEDASRMHYAGNIFDNEKLIKTGQH